VRLRDPVHSHISDIVAVVGIFGPGISKADEKFQNATCLIKKRAGT